MRIALLIGFIFSFWTIVFTQNTVGLLSYNISHSYQGYTLLYPHNQPNVFLINNCGEVVHTWEDEDIYRPGNSAYILENGNLLKTKREDYMGQDSLWNGGAGGTVELRSWDNELLWSYTLNNANYRLHHDIEPLPNGNILLLAWERKSEEEAIQAGRNPELLNDGELWSEYVFEIDPNDNAIVWEWRAWDHLIQDFDPTKDNYGIIKDNPRKININYDITDGDKDWLHANSIDYNPELSQVLLNIPYFHEYWIIDKTTTTAQAQTSSGGLVNRGGDIIYRFGNAAAYDQGETGEQFFNLQHGTQWAFDFLPDLHPLRGDIISFNNGAGEDFSSIVIMETTWNMYISDYEIFNNAFPPFSVENEITHPEPTAMFSNALSSAQVLPNGNILACSGRQGYILELTPDNEIVWEYKTPMLVGNPISQGSNLNINENLTFEAKRYPLDFTAFDGKDLSTKGFIELDPNEDYCDQLTSTDTNIRYDFKIFPNPADGMIHLEWSSGKIVQITISDILGRKHIKTTGNGGMMYLDIGSLRAGIYFVTVQDHGILRLVVE